MSPKPYCGGGGNWPGFRMSATVLGYLARVKPDDSVSIKNRMEAKGVQTSEEWLLGTHLNTEFKTHQQLFRGLEETFVSTKAAARG